MARFTPLLAALALGSVMTPACAQAATEDAGYRHYLIGDRTAPTPAKPEQGLLLSGGGDWNKDAYRWFTAKAGHGHIVVLRASQGGEAGDALYKDIGGIASAESFVFTDRKAAYDPQVLAAIDKADGVYIAGGDQSRYIRYWKDTPLARALEKLAQTRPIGGTSAGLAILGQHAYGAVDGTSATARGALRDPLAPIVSMENGFLTLPHGAHLVTDTHFIRRDRMGRLIAFVAKQRQNGDPQAYGLGVDEGSALCVDAKGDGVPMLAPGGHIWLVQPEGMPKRARAGQPLDYPVVRITALDKDSRINLDTQTVSEAAFSGQASVRQGRLRGVPFAPDSGWELAVQAGTGEAIAPEREDAYRAGIAKALAAGEAVLRDGGSSSDAVEAAVKALEDDPLFGVARGVLREAAVMDGSTAEAGAITAFDRTASPVGTAREVMERAHRALLSGSAAERYITDRALTGKAQAGFIGAVARDRFGHLAAATSGSGASGAVGPTAVAGAGLYAAENRCAAVAMANGDFVLRQAASRQACDRLRWAEQTIDEAVGSTIDAISELGGEGAVIAIDREGHIGFAMNTKSMPRGLASGARKPAIAVRPDETPK